MPFSDSEAESDFVNMWVRRDLWSILISIRFFQQLLVNQEEHQDTSGHQDTSARGPARKLSISGLSHDQIRTNVINEIISTERDFVKHLRDVVEVKRSCNSCKMVSVLSFILLVHWRNRIYLLLFHSVLGIPETSPQKARHVHRRASVDDLRQHGGAVPLPK